MGVFGIIAMVVGFVAVITSTVMFEDRARYTGQVFGVGLGTLIIGMILMSGQNEANQNRENLKTEKAYNLEIIKSTDEGFVATDKGTGKTLKCSFTKDGTVLVCDGEIREKSK